MTVSSSYSGQTAIILMLVGLAIVVGTCVLEVPQALLNRTWPAANATVTRSELITEDSGSPEGGQRTFARIDFTYAVAGKPFRGRWEPRKFLAMWGAPSSVVAKYPPGAAIDVYYSPRAPESYVMDRGFTLRLILQLIAGAATLIVGAFMCYATRKSARAD